MTQDYAFGIDEIGIREKVGSCEERSTRKDKVVTRQIAAESNLPFSENARNKKQFGHQPQNLNKHVTGKLNPSSDRIIV